MHCLAVILKKHGRHFSCWKMDHSIFFNIEIPLASKSSSKMSVHCCCNLLTFGRRAARSSCNGGVAQWGRSEQCSRSSCQPPRPSPSGRLPNGLAGHSLTSWRLDHVRRPLGSYCGPWREDLKREGGRKGETKDRTRNSARMSCLSKIYALTGFELWFVLICIYSMVTVWAMMQLQYVPDIFHLF